MEFYSKFGSNPKKIPNRYIRNRVLIWIGTFFWKKSQKNLEITIFWYWFIDSVFESYAAAAAAGDTNVIRLTNKMFKLDSNYIRF